MPAPNRLRSGSLGIDIALGGGYKPGIYEIWGEPGSGKTTLAEHALYELERHQNALWVVAGAEVPHRPLDAAVAHSRHAEEAFEFTIGAIMAGARLVVVDNANGLVRERELDGDPDYIPHPQREYKIEVTETKLTCEHFGATVIFLSKPRDKDRQPVRGTGISEKSVDRVSLKIWRSHQDGVKEVQAKTKHAQAPVAISIRPGEGIDWAMELLHLAVRFELVESNGSWYTLGSEQYQGARQAAEAIRTNTRLAVDLDEMVRAYAKIL